MDFTTSSLPISLLELLGTVLVLRHLSPYLGIRSLFSLAATSKRFKRLVFDTPGVFQYVDLSPLKARLDFLRETGRSAEQLNIFAWKDETTDESYARPLKMVLQSLQNHGVLQDVRTLVLDGLPVAPSILREILCDDPYNIRILSMRETLHLGNDAFVQILRYITRRSRPEGTPKLKGLYYFSSSEATFIRPFSSWPYIAPQHAQQAGITNTVGAQLGAGLETATSDVHYQSSVERWPSGRDSPSSSTFYEFANLVNACARVIAFDVVVCRGKTGHEKDPRPRLASEYLGGCQSCGSCPEGPAYPGISPECYLPLVSPAPLHSSDVQDAQRFDTQGLPYPPFIARCIPCLQDRWCSRCNIWWCELCYTPPKRGATAVGTHPRHPPSGGALNSDESIKVHNGLCVSNCLMEEMLNGVGEGGMWG